MTQRIIAQFTDKCGCSVTGTDSGSSADFKRCKLHAQTPALLEALEAIVYGLDEDYSILPRDVVKARDAIQAAKGD